MRRAVFLLAALSATLFGSVPSAATSNNEQALASKVSDTLSKCLATEKTELAARYVLSVERLPQNEFDKLTGSDCMLMWSGKLMMRGFHFRAALAEALVKQQLTVLDASALDRVKPLTWPIPQPVSKIDSESGKPFSAELLSVAEQNYTRDAAQYFVSVIGECVARSAPLSVQSLVGAKAGSADESEFFKEMSSQISACVPQGEPIRFSRANLRAALATSYYRLAHAEPELESVVLTNTDASE